MKIESVIFLPMHTRTHDLVVIAIAARLSHSVITELANELIRPISWQQVGSGIAGLLDSPAGLELVLESYEN